LKKQLKKIVWDWQCTPSNAGQTLNKYSIVALLHKTTELCLSKPDLIANGFKRSGIFPWNPQAPDQTKLLPGTIFQKPTDATLPPEHDSQVDFTPIMDTTPHDMSLSTPLFDTTSEVPVIPAMDTTRQIMFTPELDITPEIMVTQEMDTTTQVMVSPVLETEPQDMAISELNTTAEPMDSLELDTTVQSMATSDTETTSQIMATSEMDTTPQSQVMFNPEMDATPEFVSVLAAAPQMESTPKPYWQGKTQTCLNCNRRILQRFFDNHQLSCQVVVASPAVGESSQSKQGTKLDTIPEFSLDDRTTHLNKFEVLLLNPTQVQEFNKLFSAKKFDVSEPIFHSWLSLKLASIPTEAEALDRILKAHTVGNVPKRKQKRKQNLPTGGARYDPTSPEWVSVLEDQENRKKKTPKKTTQEKRANPKKSGPAKVKNSGAKPTRQNPRI
jgi:hypothetical protein